MPRPVFSILIPAIFERLPALGALASKLETQANACPRGTVEIISVIDNRIATVGAKRGAVLTASRGDYMAFVDDDDDVNDNYVEEIVRAIRASPGVDVVTFDQHSYIDSTVPAIVSMRLGNLNEAHNPKAYRRAAWHTCAWRRDIATMFTFPDTYYGEDWAWAEQCNKVAKTEHHIDRVLHTYRFNSKTSRAAPPV